MTRRGDAVGYLEEALHHHIHPAAKVAGDQAIAHADDHIDDSGGHRDDQGETRAPSQVRVQISRPYRSLPNQ